MSLPQRWLRASEAAHAQLQAAPGSRRVRHAGLDMESASEYARRLGDGLGRSTAAWTKSRDEVVYTTIEQAAARAQTALKP